jgi:endonuclease YncB( thermonuclease family)
MYNYRARVTDIHDGDTYTFAIDLGLQVMLVGQKLRLAHCDAPELNTPEGKMARVWVSERMPPGTIVTIDTIKFEGDREKYGRWLAQITLPDGTDLATIMIAAGQAHPYEGGAKTGENNPGYM